VLLLLFVLSAASLTSRGAIQRGQSEPSKETLELYRTKCQLCHGPKGASPQKPLNLANGEWKHGSSTEAIVKTITGGVKGTAMMPFKGKLTEAQILDLARLVRSFDKTLEPGK
jgi:mono/diheme cytochrome c family protein